MTTEQLCLDLERAVEQLPAAKRAPAASAARAVARLSRQPYSLEEQRFSARQALAGLAEHRPEVVREGFERGRDTISNLLHRFAKREIPGFDIRGAVLESPLDFAAFNLAVRTPYFESLKVAVLSDGLQVIHSQIVHVGSVNESICAPLSVGMVVASARARHPGQRIEGFVLAHNHPSGDPSPSDADRHITAKLTAMAEALGTPLLDHVITNGERYFSFRESGLMSAPVGKSGRRTKPKLPVLPRPEGPRVGYLSDFEAFPFGSCVGLPGRLDMPEKLTPYIKTLHTADPGHHHVIYLDTRLGLRAVERVPADLSIREFTARVIDGAAREGVNHVALSFAAAPDPVKACHIPMTRIRTAADGASLKMVDALCSENWLSGRSISCREMGLLEPARPWNIEAAEEDESAVL